MRHLQTYDRRYKRENKKHAPKCDRFFKENDARHNRANSSDARPYGISRAYGYGVYGLGQQHHAQWEACQKARAPSPMLNTNSLFHLTQTEGETRLKQSRHNQYQPIHSSINENTQ